MKCWLDLDGVLADFVTGVCQKHAIKNPYIDHKNRGIYDLCKVTKIPFAQLWNPLDEEFWANLRPTKDFNEILMMVEHRYDDIDILTSPCPNDGCLIGKKRWIKRNMPTYLDKFTITTRKESLANSDSILIDDFDHNVDAFQKKGNAILIPRLWNRLHTWTGTTADYLMRHL